MLGVDIWVIDQACSVKMAGYWPSFFLVACLWSINTQKKNEANQYPAILTEQAWSIKDLLYDLKHKKKDL